MAEARVSRSIMQHYVELPQAAISSPPSGALILGMSIPPRVRVLIYKVQTLSAYIKFIQIADPQNGHEACKACY